MKTAITFQLTLFIGIISFWWSWLCDFHQCKHQRQNNKIRYIRLIIHQETYLGTWPDAWWNSLVATEPQIWFGFGNVIVPEKQREGEDDKDEPTKLLYVNKKNKENGEMFLIHPSIIVTIYPYMDDTLVSGKIGGTHLWAIERSQLTYTKMSLDCRRKPKHQEETQTDTGTTTSKLINTQIPQNLLTVSQQCWPLHYNTTLENDSFTKMNQFLWH